METVLQMLKIDLGISHTLRDAYFNKLIEGCKAEIEGKKITLDLTKSEDIMLLSDYSAWRYRTRTEDAGLPQNIYFRLMNAKVKGRATSV